MKTPAVRPASLAAVLAASVVASARPPLPSGFEVDSTVTLRIDDGLGPPLEGSYRERYQEVGGRVYVRRDRYTGNLKPAGYSWEMGGRPNDAVESLDPPLPGTFRRYSRTDAGIVYGILDPVYRSDDPTVLALSTRNAVQPSSITESGGRRYTVRLDPATSLVQRLEIAYPSGGVATVEAADFRLFDGVAVPSRVERTETFDGGSAAGRHTAYRLEDFHRIDHLDRDLSVGALTPGSRVKDTILGTYYEVLEKGRTRPMGAIPRPTAGRRLSVDEHWRVLGFVGLLGSALAVFGWGRAARRRTALETAPPDRP